MENTAEAQELRTEFERNAEETDCVADAIYWGRMVQQAESFLKDIDQYLDDDVDQWQSFLNTSDVDELRSIYEYDIEMFVEDVSNALSNGTFDYVERASNLDDLQNMLRNEWNPCTNELASLRAEYREKCSDLCSKIKTKVESHYGLG